MVINGDLLDAVYSVLKDTNQTITAVAIQLWVWKETLQRIITAVQVLLDENSSKCDVAKIMLQWIDT